MADSDYETWLSKQGYGPIKRFFARLLNKLFPSWGGGGE